MTTIIIALIAALGVGGGIALATNSGGGGSGGQPAAIVQPINIEQQRANLNAHLNALAPDYDLVSALTDQSQYAITLGTESDLKSAYNQQAMASGLMHLGLNGTYDNSDDDLHREPQLEGHEFTYGPQSVTATLNLRPENSGEITGTAAQFYLDNNSNLALRETSFTFTAADKNITHGNTHVSLNERYDLFVNSEEGVATTLWGPGNTIEKWTALYLGGAKVGSGSEHPGLTVADFGMWFDFIRTEGPAEGFHDTHEEKFIFYDNSFAYNPALRQQDNVTLTGNVMAYQTEGYGVPVEVPQIYTGQITLDLNLVNNTLTGSVDMDAPDAYDIPSMTGHISGSVVRFDGLAYQEGAPLPTEDNRFLGGMGKLLFGKYGLEMVGVLGNQIEIPADWGGRTGEELRDYRKQGDSGYVFGAKEN